jgi:hypothetical protein
MCPACLSTMTLMTTAGAAGGGLFAVLLRRLRARRAGSGAQS